MGLRQVTLFVTLRRAMTHRTSAPSAISCSVIVCAVGQCFSSWGFEFPLWLPCRAREAILASQLCLTCLWLECPAIVAGFQSWSPRAALAAESRERSTSDPQHASSTSYCFCSSKYAAASLQPLLTRFLRFPCARSPACTSLDPVPRSCSHHPQASVVCHWRISGDPANGPRGCASARRHYR